jgi:O-antigen ligase
VLAPQLWLNPIVGLPVHYILFPIWFFVLLIRFGLSPIKIVGQDICFLIFFIWMVASMLVNGSLFVENRDMGLVILYYLKIAVLYWFVSCSLRVADQAVNIMAIFVILAILLSIEGIQHKLTGIGWAGQTLGWIDPEVVAAGGTGRTRWVGIFDGPGVFAVIYTIALPFVLAGAEKGFSFFIRVVSIMSVPLIIVATYCNGSRGGLITTIAIFLMHFGRNLKKSKSTVFLGVAIGALLFFLSPVYMTEINDSSRSSYHRIEMWSEGMEMVISHPLFGIGRGNFKNYTSSLIAHNSAVEIMGETGFIGLLIWIGLIFMALKNTYFFGKNTEVPTQKLIAQALFISIVGYVISSMFVSLEYETFYFLLAIAGALGRQLEKPFRFGMQDLKLVLLTGFTWLVVIYGLINWYKLRYF